MADFNKAFEILKKLEYSDCSNILHKNKGEDGYTYMGIYQKAHPDSSIWQEVRNYIDLLGYQEPLTKEQIEEISKYACNNATMELEAKKIYRQKYWNRARLYAVEDQKIADEIFVFGVNAGIETAIKAAQRIVGVEADGVVGPKTLAALNSYNGKLFDILFDAEEAKYYESLVRAKKKYARFEDGWLNRAKAV